MMALSAMKNPPDNNDAPRPKSVFAEAVLQMAEGADMRREREREFGRYMKCPGCGLRIVPSHRPRGSRCYNC